MCKNEARMSNCAGHLAISLISFRSWLTKILSSYFVCCCIPTRQEFPTWPCAVSTIASAVLLRHTNRITREWHSDKQLLDNRMPPIDSVPASHPNGDRDKPAHDEPPLHYTTLHYTTLTTLPYKYRGWRQTTKCCLIPAHVIIRLQACSWLGDLILQQ